MYSFYGGQPGHSFIIITTYRSIADMVAKFKLGNEYTAVHFDQHVMINTVNKNDPDNGKIYRRGYDFNNDMGGAEFVGTIVGPAGKAPMIQMTTIADVRRKQAAQGYQERRSSGSYSAVENNLVPGKKTDGTFNDTITWECCSIRNQNNEDTTAYIGFTFPYTVIDVEASTVQPYSGGRYADMSDASRIDDYKHPFYEKWHLDIPNGVKGDSFKNLKIQVADSTIEEYQGRADDINNNREVLVYEYYNYETLQNGNPKKVYLGDYNNIDNISISQDGTITIDYSHDNDKVFNKIIKWIDDVTISDDGTLTISWNNNSADTIFNKKIKWITALNISNTGIITVNYNDNTSVTLDSVIKWINSIALSAAGILSITYNTGQIESFDNNKIKWIDSISLNANGIFTIVYNTGQTQSLTNTPVKWLNNITGSDGHILTFTYNDETTDNVDFKFLRNLDIDTGTTEGSGNQKIHVYWTDNTVTEIGNPINYIMQAAINDNEHLLVRYSDPTKRNLDTTVSWNGKAGWTDIGSLKVPYIYGDPTATNLKWSGIASLENSESGYLNIRFTMPLTQILDHNIDIINITGGRLYGRMQEETYSFNNFVLNSTNTTITKTLTGLEFSIQTEYQNTEIATFLIMPIIINQLSLEFIRSSEQQSQGE